MKLLKNLQLVVAILIYFLIVSGCTQQGDSSTPASSIDVSITSPANGEIFAKGDIIHIISHATPSSDVTKMEIFVDTTYRKTECFAASCNYNWDTSGTSIADHTITVRAEDNDGNQAEESITIEVSALKDKVICLDPGHGTGYPGPSGTAGEAEVVHAISAKLKVLLENEGAAVYETPSSYSTTQRATYANNNNADVFVSIHANGADNSVKGVESYYYKTGDEEVCNALHPYIKNIIPSEDHASGVMQYGYDVLASTNMPACLVELEFMTYDAECNPIDRTTCINTCGDDAWDLYDACLYAYPDDSWYCYDIYYGTGGFYDICTADCDDYYSYSCVRDPIFYDGKVYTTLRELLETDEYQNEAAEALFNGIVDYLAGGSSVSGFFLKASTCDILCWEDGECTEQECIDYTGPSGEQCMMCDDITCSDECLGYNRQEGTTCNDDSQCGFGMHCSGAKRSASFQRACCPENKEWDYLNQQCVGEEEQEYIQEHDYEEVIPCESDVDCSDMQQLCSHHICVDEEEYYEYNEQYDEEWDSYDQEQEYYQNDDYETSEKGQEYYQDQYYQDQGIFKLCDVGICINGDYDCDSVFDELCFASEEICNDNIDNDQDGVVDDGCCKTNMCDQCGQGIFNDCDYFECYTLGQCTFYNGFLFFDECQDSPNCVEEVCIDEICNGVDDNCNGYIDDDCYVSFGE